MNKKRILIVDDEIDIVETIQFMLESQAFECLAAYDGEDALLKARTENPDLILLDIMLPKMNGFEVCEKLKSDKCTKSIPVLMITALKELKDNDNVKFIYLSIPTFSLSVYLEIISPEVFHRQLSGGHTHLYTEKSYHKLKSDVSPKQSKKWKKYLHGWNGYFCLN